MKFLNKPKNECKYMTVGNMTKAMWNWRLQHPLIMEDKSEAPLAIWGDLTDYPEIDVNSGYPRCIGDNVNSMYALQVDVDNGCTMSEFVRDFHRYSFQLYTSYGYGFKPGDRFRVIFPLKERLYIKWLVPPVKQILKDLFSMSDPTCFDKGHFQIVPCVRSNDAPYRYLQHDGELLSFATDNFGKIAMEYSEDFHWKREIAEADRDPNANHAGALKYVQEVFDKTEVGSRDRVVYAKLMFLKDTVGCTFDEVINLRPPVGFDEEYVAKVNRLYLGR